MLIDGNSLLYRAFFALPLLQTKDGIYTNGVYGFLTMLNRAVRELARVGIRWRHPGYTEEQVRMALIRLTLGESLFGEAFPGATATP